MNLEIYYFSGTGNSLAAARMIAGQTGGSLLSIASTAKRDRIQTKADCIGIVFPCYLAQLNGIPLIVESFVKKLEGLDSKYIFAVCTCGGYECVDALPTLKKLGSLIRSVGGTLTGEFSMRLPMNNLRYLFFQTHNHDKMFRNSERKSAEIVRRILDKRRNKYYFIQTVFNYFMTPLYLVLQNFYVMDLRQKAKEPQDVDIKFRQLIPLTDRSISTDGKCTGCSVCTQVCPVRNIMMDNNRPVWQNRCEMCMACVEWCPQNAVHHWNIDEGKKYHHPDITILDMLAQRDS